MIRKTIGPAMFDVARRGPIRRRDGVRQLITREESGEMGGAPHIPAARGIAGTVDARRYAGYEFGA